MAKRRKSIRKRVPKLAVNTEEAEDQDQDAPGEVEIDYNDEQVDVPNEEAVVRIDEREDRPDDTNREVGEGGEEAKREEKAQEDWDSFKVEHHEIIEQLPLSLYRSMALMRELDDQVQEHTDELLQCIREYVRLRESLAPKSDTHGPPDEANNVLANVPQSDTANVPINEERMDIHNGINGLDKLEETEEAKAQVHGETTIGGDTLLDQSNPPNFEPPQSDSGVGASSMSPLIVVDDSPADGQEEVPSTPVANGVIQDPAEKESEKAEDPVQQRPSASPTKRFLVPPNPFALTRSHPSFSLSARKAKQKPMLSTVDILRRISNLTQALVRASEEKLGLASNAYDLTDRHVRSLDAAIKGYETSLVLGTRSGTRPTNAVLPAGDAAIFAAGDDADGQIAEVAGDIAVQLTASKPKTKKGRERKRSGDTRKKYDDEKGVDLGVSLEPDATPALNVGMPVSEHEPVYCTCRSVSAGVMVACDAEDCQFEWFHLSCVGLAEPPKGRNKWYCPDCQKNVDRSKHTRKKRKTSHSVT
ncbi:hypothetical protein FRB94_004929 [Tulasnella sp. JGI-2019a]|nr:hypothetical protein FRB93_005582 [Tulasnella sp. JGI-2019a]KAG9001131.1 hypothetical protein FRB94_004929 [Tulasnella sp. JGI-2019a]